MTHHEQGPSAMRFANAAASAAIVTMLSITCADALPVTLSGETNLRKSPGTDSDVLTLIPKGATVEVGKCANDWCEASYEGKDGFVIGRNVGVGPRPAPQRRPHPGAQVVEEEVVVGPGPGRAYPAPPPGYPPPPVYYRPYPYGYYGGYYRPWGWGWGWRW